MGQAQINVRTRACSGTFIARTTQAALTQRLNHYDLRIEHHKCHICMVSHLCEYVCDCIWSRRKNLVSHISHLNGFSLV